MDARTSRPGRFREVGCVGIPRAHVVHPLDALLKHFQAIRLRRAGELATAHAHTPAESTLRLPAKCQALVRPELPHSVSFAALTSTSARHRVMSPWRTQRFVHHMHCLSAKVSRYAFDAGGRGRAPCCNDQQPLHAKHLRHPQHRSTAPQPRRQRPLFATSHPIC